MPAGTNVSHISKGYPDEAPRCPANIISAGAATPPRESLAGQPLRSALPWWHSRFANKSAELRAGPADIISYGDSIIENLETAPPNMA